MMYLARRVRGQALQVYALRPAEDEQPRVWVGRPRLGDAVNGAPSLLCAPGVCAIDRTRARAVAALHAAEQAAQLYRGNP